MDSQGYDICPPAIVAALNRYIQGVPTGDFLRAVLGNDLREAFGRADGENREALFAIVQYCYKKLPAVCWGSYARVDAWLEAKRKQAEAPTP